MQRSTRRLFARYNSNTCHTWSRRGLRLLALTGASFALALPATAADTPEQTGLHGLVTGGLTMGGETVLPMQYTNGKTAHLRGGNFIQLGLGAQWRMESVPLALAMTANYHVDQSAAADGFGEFIRYPLEAILYYVGDDWRFGLGGRRVLLPEVRARNDTSHDDLTIRFSDTNGVIAEIGYAATEHLWLNFRLVREEYRGQTAKLNGAMYDARSLKYDGSHIGVNFAYVF
jgi:hypothetical protein